MNRPQVHLIDMLVHDIRARREGPHSYKISFKEAMRRIETLYSTYRDLENDHLKTVIAELEAEHSAFIYFLNSFIATRRFDIGNRIEPVRFLGFALRCKGCGGYVGSNIPSNAISIIGHPHKDLCHPVLSEDDVEPCGPIVLVPPEPKPVIIQP